MLAQGSELGRGRVVVADRGPGGLVSFVLLPIGFLAGAIAVLKLLAVVHGSTQGLVWVAALGGLLTVAVVYLVVVRVYDWVDAHRAGGRRPRAEIDSEGVMIVPKRGEPVAVKWGQVAGTAPRDGGTWLVGPAGRPVAEVPTGLFLLNPGFAHAVVTARPDRFALGEDGRHFTLRGDATVGLDPDRWLFAQRLGARLDLLVLCVGAFSILVLSAAQAGEIVFFVWGVCAVAWLAVFRDMAVALIAKRVGRGARGIAG